MESTVKDDKDAPIQRTRKSSRMFLLNSEMVKFVKEFEVIFRVSMTLILIISTLLTYTCLATCYRCGVRTDATSILLLMSGALSLVVAPWLLFTLPTEKCEESEEGESVHIWLRNLTVTMLLCWNSLASVVALINWRSWFSGGGDNGSGGCVKDGVYVFGLVYLVFFWVLVVGCVIIRRLFWMYMVGFIVLNYLSGLWKMQNRKLQ